MMTNGRCARENLMMASNTVLPLPALEFGILDLKFQIGNLESPSPLALRAPQVLGLELEPALDDHLLALAQAAEDRDLVAVLGPDAHLAPLELLGADPDIDVVP